MTTIDPAALPLAVNTAPRAGMRDFHFFCLAVRSEWIKISTLRTNKILLGLTAGLGGAIALALAATDTEPAVPASELFIYPLPLVATLAIVTGILMLTAEAQHGTLAVTLAARPARWVIALAKTSVAVAAGLAYGTAAMIAGLLGALAGGASLVDASAMLPRALWALLYIVVAAVIGLGVGMIVRHSAGAITGLLVWSFVLEPLIAPALPDGILHFLPFSTGYRLLDAGAGFEPPVVVADELSRALYALIFAGYGLISLTIGTRFLYQRDT